MMARYVPFESVEDEDVELVDVYDAVTCWPGVKEPLFSPPDNERVGKAVIGKLAFSGHDSMKGAASEYTCLKSKAVENAPGITLPPSLV